MNRIKVKLSDADCRKVEQKFFEYQAIKDIVAFINCQEAINIGALKVYMTEAEERFAELERAKREVSKENCPDSFAGIDYDYEFDFNSQELIYSKAEN